MPDSSFVVPDPTRDAIGHGSPFYGDVFIAGAEEPVRLQLTGCKIEYPAEWPQFRDAVLDLPIPVEPGTPLSTLVTDIRDTIRSHFSSYKFLETFDVIVSESEPSGKVWIKREGWLYAHIVGFGGTVIYMPGDVSSTFQELCFGVQIS